MRHGSGSFLGFSFVIALATAACTSSTTTSVLAPSPVPGRCAATVNPSAQTVAADGTVGTLSITTARECQWTISGLTSWLQVTAASGQGPADVTYTVGANRSTSPRTAQMTVLDQPVVITQAAAVCTFGVTPAELSVTFSGDSARIKVSADDFCSWTARSLVSWIDVRSADEGRGNGEIDVRIGRNTGGRRSGTVEVAGKSVVVSQREAAAPEPSPVPPPAFPESCAYSVNPTSITLSDDDRRANISLTTQTSCPVSASSDVSWMKVKSQPKTGSGTIEVEVERNSRDSGRSGGIIVSGYNFSQTVTVTQRGDEDD
jgi:hypothetical protein